MYLLIVLILSGAGYLYTHPDLFNSWKTEGGGGGVAPTNTTFNVTTVTNVTTMTICSWNLQVYGVTKADNIDIMDSYKKALSQCDIAIVQEIRDDSGTAFPKLCSLMAGYQCAIGERKGRSSSKEQIGIIFRGAELDKVTESEDYVKWERPPTVFDLNINHKEVTLVSLHSKPSDAPNELKYLDAYASNISGSVIALGDFNMGCDYYQNPHSDFLNWTCVISDNEDTTVAQTFCPYDRIFMKELEYQNYGIDSTITEPTSDHYLVLVRI